MKQKCINCGTGTQKTLFKTIDHNFHSKNEYKIIQCNKCKLAWTEPKLTSNKLKKHYWKYYKSAYSSNKLKELMYKIQYLIQRPIIFKKTPGKLLDIGCGPGKFLKLQKEKGWNVYGYDIDVNAIEKGKTDMIEIKKTLKNFDKKSFDVITLFHTLEHEPKPITLLKKVHQLLKNNGLLIIEVPNFKSLENAVFKKYDSYLAVPRHMYHFNEKALVQILEKEKFKILKIKHQWLNPQAISSSLINLMQKNLKKGINMKTRITLTIIFSPITIPLNWIFHFMGKSATFTIYAIKN